MKKKRVDALEQKYGFRDLPPGVILNISDVTKEVAAIRYLAEHPGTCEDDYRFVFIQSVSTDPEVEKERALRRQRSKSMDVEPPLEDLVIWPGQSVPQPS